MSVEIVDVTPPTIELQDVVAGPRGPAGVGSGATAYAQSSALATWTIAHTLGRIPVVQVYDNFGAQVDPDIAATTTQVVITFPAPATGTVLLG